MPKARASKRKSTSPAPKPLNKKKRLSPIFSKPSATVEPTKLVSPQQSPVSPLLDLPAALSQPKTIRDDPVTPPEAVSLTDLDSQVRDFINNQYHHAPHAHPVPPLPDTSSPMVQKPLSMPGHLMAPLYSKWSSLEMFLDQPWFAYIPTSWSRVKGVTIDKHTETYSVAAVTMSAIGFGTRLAHAGVINSSTALTIIGKVVDCSFGLNGTLKSRHELDKMITMSLGLVQAREVANADLSTTNLVDSVLNSALNHFEGFSLPPPKLDRTATSWKKQGWKDQDRWTSKQKSGSNWQGNWQGNAWWYDEGSKSKARQADTSDKHSKPSS